LGALPPVVLVDWYNTLSTSTFWSQWASPGHPMVHAYDAIQARRLSTDRLRIADWMRGRLTSEQFNLGLANELGLDFDELHPAFIESCVAMRLDFPDVCLSVRRIRGRGGKVFVATDNMDSFCRWTVPALGLESVFDGVLSSHQVGSSKEDLSTRGDDGFFRIHLGERGVEPGECLLVDDSESTVEP
jgi:FMN phosphatase YigB (HAD superfamily)